jgi:hypothetical protein
MVFGFDGSPTLTRLLRSLASRLWLWTRGPTLDADQCINVARYRCCRLQAAAVELLLALFLLPRSLRILILFITSTRRLAELSVR